jgi:hypothetical protein
MIKPAMIRSALLALSLLIVFLAGMQCVWSLTRRSADEEHFERRLRKFLLAMNQPRLEILANKDRNAVIYRFVWLPSFHNAIGVRFDRSNDGAVVDAVMLSGMGGYEPGTIIARRTAKLGAADWARIASGIDKAKFWTLPTCNPLDPRFEDGDDLIFEGVKDGKYHVVYRRCPNKGDFVELCQAMLFMSGIDVRKNWFEYRQ